MVTRHISRIRLLCHMLCLFRESAVKHHDSHPYNSADPPHPETQGHKPQRRQMPRVLLLLSILLVFMPSPLLGDEENQALLPTSARSIGFCVVAKRKPIIDRPPGGAPWVDRSGGRSGLKDATRGCEIWLLL